MTADAFHEDMVKGCRIGNECPYGQADRTRSTFTICLRERFLKSRNGRIFDKNKPPES